MRFNFKKILGIALTGLLLSSCTRTVYTRIEYIKEEVPVFCLSNSPVECVAINSNSFSIENIELEIITDSGASRKATKKERIVWDIETDSQGNTLAELQYGVVPVGFKQSIPPKELKPLAVYYADNLFFIKSDNNVFYMSSNKKHLPTKEALRTPNFLANFKESSVVDCDERPFWDILNRNLYSFTKSPTQSSKCL